VFRPPAPYCILQLVRSVLLVSMNIQPRELVKLLTSAYSMYRTGAWHNNCANICRGQWKLVDLQDAYSGDQGGRFTSWRSYLLGPLPTLAGPVHPLDPDYLQGCPPPTVLQRHAASATGRNFQEKVCEIYLLVQGLAING
jgi:hypothetical protein